MTERCVIKKVKRGLAYIEITRNEKCDGCKMCSFNNKKSIVVPAVCKIPVEIGREAVAEMPTRAVGAASLLVYALPILFIALGALVGYACGKWWLQPILAAVGLVSGLICAVVIDRAYRRRSGVLPTVLEMIEERSDLSDEQNKTIR